MEINKCVAPESNNTVALLENKERVPVVTINIIYELKFPNLNLNSQINILKHNTEVIPVITSFLSSTSPSVSAKTRAGVIGRWLLPRAVTSFL